MAFDTFVFDLDGTLLDTLPDLVVITNQALGELGFPPRSHDEILSYVGNGVRALMCQAVPEGTSPEQAEPAPRNTARCSPPWLIGNHLTKPYPHMRETLTELSARGARMGVLSNKFDAGVQQVMNQFMPGVFAVMHGECDGIPRKPDPAGLLRTIDELGSTPTRTAYVGDSPGYVKVAQNAGAFAIGVWGYHHADELRAAQANVVIDSPEELLRFASERS